MKKAAVPILVAVILLTVAVVTEAQQPKKVPRIGYLSSADPVLTPPVTRQFGWLCARVTELLEGQVLQSNIPAYRAKISVSTCDDCVLKIDLFNGIKQ